MEGKMFRDGTALLVTLALVVIGVLVMLGVMLHLHVSLFNAVNELHVCERQGGIKCHIERDGLEYNVYRW